MIRRVRPQCSPALVVSCIALLVALGGTSYATVLNVPKNSVGTRELQRNAVTAAKISPNAVRTGHVLDGSLLAEDFKPGQLPSGPKGDKGDRGDRGEPGVGRLFFTKWSIPDQGPISVPSTAPVRVTSLEVPAGTYLVTATLGVLTNALFCTLQPGGTAASGNGTDGSIVVMDRLSFAGDSKVEVWCRRGPIATYGSVLAAKVAAIQVRS